MNRSTFWMIKYMNGSVFSKVYEWGRFWNTGSHTRTKITPKLPPPPPTPRALDVQDSKQNVTTVVHFVSVVEKIENHPNVNVVISRSKGIY